MEKGKWRKENGMMEKGEWTKESAKSGRIPFSYTVDFIIFGRL